MDIPAPRPEDALAQLTRARLFSLLADLGHAAGTDDLAAHIGLHPNGVRAHLERLEQAGLVTRRRVPQPRGRPRDEWAVAPSAEPAGAPPRAYRHLAGWLARAIPATPGRLRQVERAGREIGRELAPDRSDSAEEALGHAFSALGFQPTLESRPGGQLSCRLRNCPYRDSVKENRDVVCTLHRGITRGVLDAVAPGARLTAFIPHDPDTAGCEVEVDRLGAAHPT